MFHGKTLRMHFIRNFVAVMLIPVTISGLLQAFVLFQNTYNNIIDSSKNSIAKADAYFSLIAQNTENLANIVSYNSGIQKLIVSDLTLKTAPENYNSWKDARNMLISNFISYDIIFSNAVLFNSKGNAVLSLYRYNENSRLDDYKWKKDLEATYGNPIWIPAHIDNNDLNASNEHVITLAKKIRAYDSEQVGDDLGYLVINLKIEKLYEKLNKFVLSSNATFLIQNQDGIITAHADSSKIGSRSGITVPVQSYDSFFTKVDGKSVLMAFYKDEKTGWYLIQLLSISTIFANSISYLLSTLVIFFALLIIFIIVSIRISSTISKPIYNLESRMELVEKGIFKFENVKKSNVLEIDRLIMRFGVMSHRLNNLIEEVYKSNLKEKELEAAVHLAELKSLQQQINPHFLYNTLDSINWMASLGANEEVSTMVTTLSDFFRFSISRGINFVTIASEVENIRNYIYLQQIRFGPSLTTEIDMSPDVKECLTMKLLLQPIVENAVLHGIQAKSGGGKIIIRILKENNTVVFTIEDNGVGMDQETIDKILSTDKEEKNVGLRNVIQRMSLLFNENYTFKIDSRLNEGTLITVVIPCFYNEEQLQ